MHSTKRQNGRTRLEWASASVLLVACLIFAGTAHAQGAHRYHEQRQQLNRRDAVDSVRDARRVDRRLDHRGRVINHHYDFLAVFAALAGDYALADALDRRGDRAERYYDRKGDRILRRTRVQAHRHHAGCGHSGIIHHDRDHNRHHLAPRRAHERDSHRDRGRGRGHGPGHGRH